MIRRPPRSTLDRSSAASDVYKRQEKPHLFLVADCKSPLLDCSITPLLHLSNPRSAVRDPKSLDCGHQNHRHYRYRDGGITATGHENRSSATAWRKACHAEALAKAGES